MKRAILTAALLFGKISLAPAIEPDPAAEAAVEPQMLSETTNVASLAFHPEHYNLGSNLGFAFAPQSGPRPQASQPPPSSADRPRPRSEGSMIGYIENAIVGSEIRIRSEAGFGAQFPDRAEFFYAKCGCYQSNLAGSGLPSYDPNAPGPGPGVVTALNFQQLFMEAEYAPSRRFSMLVEVPVRWIQPTAFVPGFGSFGNQGGLGDVTAAVKAALLASPRHYLTVQLKGYFPTGDASKGLGTNHYSVEPAMLYYQAVSSRLSVESEFGIWHPIGGSAGVVSASDPTPQSFAGNVLFYGIGPSYQLFRGEHVRFSPVVEMVGWSVLGGFQTVWISSTRIGDPADGNNIVNLKIGARTELGGGNSFYIGYGRGLTSAIWYSDLVRFEYRHSF